ncbi:hypothetical protein [uncultured Sphingomonas sp.]|uniref:hypothetical protein n=1 Tax=uncultured Sphingomonas sp. TaxID=158754 RepID=UPI0035CAAC43
MTDYRGNGTGNDNGARRVDGRTDHVVGERKRGGIGRTLLILLAIAAIIAAILFATGFFRADMNGGALPNVDVSVKGGALPDVDVDSKSVDLTTEKETIEVPKLKVTEGASDKDGADKN